jgi:hypothetical protein
MGCFISFRNIFYGCMDFNNRKIMSNKKQTDHIVDSNKMVTAVEWLFKELLNSEPNILEWNKLLEQAKAMEKEQIENAFCDGNDHEPLEVPKDSAEQYYLETYEK